MMMYWCHLKTFPVVLKKSLEQILITPPKLNIPPIIDKIISCFVATAIAPIAPPIDKEPVSAHKYHCWGALYQRKPKPEPINATQIITNSPVSLT